MVLFYLSSFEEVERLHFPIFVCPKPTNFGTLKQAAATASASGRGEVQFLGVTQRVPRLSSNELKANKKRLQLKVD